MGVELPSEYSAWTKDGQPVRRIATNGNATQEAGYASDLSPMLFAEAQRDRLIYGDAWATLDGKRVSPFDVYVQRMADAKPEKLRPDDYPRAPWDAPDDEPEGAQ